MKPTLLITDSDESLMDLYRRLFSDHGYQVETAFGVDECMTKMVQFLPDILILDLDLPWARNEDVLAQLDQARVHRAPLLIVTTETPDLALPSFVQAPVVTYLRKPFHLKDLAAKVSNAATLAYL